MRPTALATASPLYYVEAGNGAPVVLLHGMGCDSRTWDPVRAPLAANWRVFTPDLPGHGRSPKPWRTFKMDLYVDYLVRWLEALGTGPVHLIGHSFGGAVAVNIALKRPDLVRSLMALSSVRLVEHTPPKPVLRTFMRYGLGQLFGPPSEAAARRFLDRGFGVPQDLLTPALVTLFQETAAASTRAVVSTNRQLRRPESVLFGWLDQVRCPVTLVWGTRDPLYPGREKVEQVAARFPQATLELLNCGHLPMFEEPGALLERLELHLSAGDRVGIKPL